MDSKHSTSATLPDHQPSTVEKVVAFLDERLGLKEKIVGQHAIHYSRRGLWLVYIGLPFLGIQRDGGLRDRTHVAGLSLGSV